MSLAVISILDREERIVPLLVEGRGTCRSLCEYECEIEGLIESGLSLEEVEAVCESYGLGEEECEALKLYAWAWRETMPRR